MTRYSCSQTPTIKGPTLDFLLQYLPSHSSFAHCSFIFLRVHFLFSPLFLPPPNHPQTVSCFSPDYFNSQSIQLASFINHFSDFNLNLALNTSAFLYAFNSLRNAKRDREMSQETVSCVIIIQDLSNAH
jgi:hypothetical protein